FTDCSKIHSLFTDCSKIHSLGWKHKIELEDGIKMMYKWYLKEQNIRQ
ncbi:GDP-L-fucose synthase, partial [Campylobacter jejuni]|nr:GDP-L-fucose synthase [Campylobacter jejuni]